MAQVPISFTSQERRFAGLPAAVLTNRFFEETPTQEGGVAMLARPGTKTLGRYDSEPIRATYSQVGLFNGALFFVCGERLYRREVDGTTVQITGAVMGTTGVSMVGVAGVGYQRLFIADGTLLQRYEGGTHATGVLTATNQVSDGDTIQIDEVWYQWVTTMASGDGLQMNPFKVLIGADLEESLDNMTKAITFTGVSGVDYSPQLSGKHPTVMAVNDLTTLTAVALSDLADGNLIQTSVEPGGSGDVSWSDPTLTGGDNHALIGVAMPDGEPPISVTVLKSYVIIALGRSDRFYWLQPGSVVIDGLDFATAESQPDFVLQAETVGDTVWFVGEDTTEVWYATGDSAFPFRPVGGRVYDQGAREGTVVNIKGTVFLVGSDNVVYSVAGGVKRISNHGVEELLRLYMED